MTRGCWTSPFRAENGRGTPGRTALRPAMLSHRGGPSTPCGRAGGAIGGRRGAPDGRGGHGRAAGPRRLGVCVLGPDDPPASADTLLVRSDTAMYAAKRAGKDRVVTYTPGLHREEVATRPSARSRRELASGGGLRVL